MYSDTCLTCTLISNSKKSSSVVGWTNVEETTEDEAEDVDDTSDSEDEVATELVPEWDSSGG